jgi:hypothetical protein
MPPLLKVWRRQPGRPARRRQLTWIRPPPQASIIVQHITAQRRLLVAAVYASLSVVMPWTFYRAGRELGLAREPALTLWVLITWAPSLFVIFHYIMIETVLLPIEGFCLWMTARYIRKGDGLSFAVCVGCWVLACLTKPALMVLAIVCMGYAWWRMSRRLTLLLGGCGLAFILFLPQCVRSYYYLGFVAPTGSHWTPEILHKADTTRISIQAGSEGHWGFSSPSCYEEPLEPLSSWMIHRAYQDSTTVIQVKVSDGERDWKQAYDQLERSWQVWWRQWIENMIIVLFAPSWPDSNRHNWDGWINYESRWMWAPLIFVVMELNYREFRHGRWDLIPVAVTVLTAVLLFQNMIDMEGRYRKPLEPLLLLNLVWALGPRSAHELPALKNSERKGWDSADPLRGYELLKQIVQR